MKNFKLSCVGVDSKGATGRMIFYEYDVEDMESAISNTRKNSYRRKVMRRHDLDWRSVEFNVVECDDRGNTLPDFVDEEKKIRAKEKTSMKRKKKSFDRKAREEYWKQLEKEKGK